MSNSINAGNVTPPTVQIQPAATTASAPIRDASAVHDTVGTAIADPAAITPSDRTTLSPLGQILSSATTAAASLSSFRPERVAQLRSGLADGSYQPNLSLVAQRVSQALTTIGR